MQIVENKKCKCPICGGNNACVMAAADSIDVQCWCYKYKITGDSLDRIAVAQKNKSCVCMSCVTKFESSFS